MSLRARVKQEPQPGVADQVWIKQEPESYDAAWGSSEAAYSASLLVKQEPAPLDQEPTSVLHEWVSLQQDIFNPTVSNDPVLTEEPMWMGGSGPDPPDPPQVKREREVPPPAPAPPAPIDAKYSSLVRDCWVRLERCVVPRGAVERLARRPTDRREAVRPRGRPTDRRGAARPRGRPTNRRVAARPRGRPPSTLEKQLAMAQLDYLIRTNQRRKKLYTCHVCKKEFVMMSHFIDHKQIHKKNNETIPVFLARPGVTPAKPYLCEICKAGFDDLKTLKVHALVHAKFGKKPYVCEICNIRFSSVLQFDSHRKHHAKLRPFQCRFCQKRFALKSHLGRHMFHHKLERDLCKACEQKRALRLLGSLMLRPGDVDDGDDGDTERCDTCGRDT